MNTLPTFPKDQNITNTTSLSNGILKKLAITLAVSAIGVSTLVPIAYAESEVVAQAGDIITVEEDIYGISGNFADGGTLTVKLSGTSFADDLREIAGNDGNINMDEFLVYVDEDASNSKVVKFTALMGDNIDADGNMQVDDILAVVPVIDALSDLDEDTDGASAVSVDDIIDAIPDGVSRDKKESFAEQLEELTAEDGTISQSTAEEKLTAFVLENPGNELEEIDADGNVLGFTDTEGNNPDGVGINLRSEKNLTLNNEVDIYSEDRSIVVVSANENDELLGDVTVINSGDLTNGGGSILSAYGKNVTVENSGELESTSDSSRNGISVGAAETVNITNTGEIELSTENKSDAISISSEGGDIIIDNDGDLTISGEEGYGIEAYSGANRSYNGEAAIEGGDVDVTNSGTIETDGDFSYAIATWSNGGNVDVSNSGKLTTNKQGSTGIDIYSGTNRTEDGRVVQKGGDVSFESSGAISTVGKDSYGIIASSYGGAADGINSGDITTKGENSDAIEISSGTNKTTGERVPLIGGNVTLENSGELSTEGTGSNTIAAWSNGGEVDVINEGTLATLKNWSAGIVAYSGTNKTFGNRKIQEGDAVTVTNSGEINTEGDNSWGIDAGSYGGTVDVDNSGDISTKGLDSAALILTSGNTRTDGERVPLRGSDVIAKNTGDLSTEGDYSSGLHAFSNGGKITASNEGKIVTGGEESHGIRLSSGLASRDSDVDEQVGGDITLTNEGVIETSGDKAYNISTWANGGEISVTNEAKLTATGENSRGIKANSGHEEDGEIITAGGNITINNTGEIVGTGVGIDGSIGIKAESVADKDQGGDVKIINSGNVTATGGGIGIEAAKNGDMTNSGDITVKGEDSGGLLILAEDTASLTNTGNVEVEGQLGLAAVALNSASIDNSGDVSLVRNWSEAASSWNPAIGTISLNDASLKNSGKVTVSGDNMIGLYAGETNSDATKKATIENSGVVNTKGNDKAHAAYISLDGTGTLTNSGSLTTEGKANAVVVDGKGGFTLDNAAAGVIEAKDGLAIVTEDTKDEITNLGIIKGGATLAAGDDELDNKGILEGNFDFGDGKDTLNVSDLSKVSAATFDGGASDDVANLSGGGEIATDQIVNFETANLLSGDFSGNVMDKFTKLVNVESGASLSGFNKVNNLTSSGTVSVAAGETLDVTGDLNIEGGTFNLGVDSTSKHAVVNVSGDASFASTSNLFVNVVKDSSLTLDESVTVLNGKTLTFDEKIASTAKEAETEFDVEDDYISYDFSGRVEKAEKGDQLVLTVRDSIGSVIEEVGEEYGGAIKHIASLSNDKVSEENSVLTELKKRIDAGNIQEAQELMDEVVSSPGASQIASTQNTSSFTAGNMVINRAAARIDGGYTATLSADDSSNILGYNPEYKSAPHIRNIMAMTDEGTEASLATTGYNGEIWMQVYGVYQENGGKVSGETNVFGGAAGIDFLAGPGTVFGLGLVYSNSDSDADTANAHTDVETDSYGLTAYGMTQLDEGYRLGGSLAYYWNSHDLKRQILTNQMEADYDSTTFVARAELGKEYDMDGYTFMPQIGAIYTTNSADSYTETGPLAQAVRSTDTDSFIGQVGFVVNSEQEWNGMLVRPDFHMNILHEFNDELGSFSGALAADNTVSVSSTITSIEETRYNIGGGLKLNHTTAFASEFGYDGIFAEDTQEHLFRYKASYKY